MISGGVHSGPVGGIRHGGYVGLCLLLIILVMQAREAWRLIHLAYSTPLRTLSLFVCVPIVFEPVFFTLIFGAYENAIPDAFYNLGMLRMLRNSVQDQAPHERAQAPAELPAPLPGPARNALPEFAGTVANSMIPPTA